jgi:hypothetical protein
MNESNLSLETLLQETLVFTEYIRTNNLASIASTVLDIDQFDASERFIDQNFHDLISLKSSEIHVDSKFFQKNPQTESFSQASELPESSGIIYKIDNSISTFCVRGYSCDNIREAFVELNKPDSTKRLLLKLNKDSTTDSIQFFETKNVELAVAACKKIINRRFPHQEDTLCNISDPGFSWWMDIDQANSENMGRFEIFFKSHGINRAEKYIQLGPIGDGAIAALRMNQAHTLLRSSFPIGEFSCDGKSFTVASLKPDHLSFISFKKIFLEGINLTELENFPDNDIGRTLFYYFQELAIVRKFWIEVKTKLG